MGRGRERREGGRRREMMVAKVGWARGLGTSGRPSSSCSPVLSLAGLQLQLQTRTASPPSLANHRDGCATERRCPTWLRR